MTRSTTWCLGRVGAIASALTWLVLNGWTVHASAETGGEAEEPAATEGEEAEEVEAASAAGVHVVGFRDLPGDCDTIAARFGRCIEEVEFVDLLPAFSDRQASATQLALWRNSGKLYAQLWEDLAQRWFRNGDVIELTMKTHGLSQLPTTAVQWEASARKDKLVYGLPGPELWLDRNAWIQPKGRESGAFFRRIRFLTPEGQGAQPSMVLLKGRFALRLGFSGRRHDYDLMNGDPMSSGPFFEQMYPYSKAMETSDGDLVPLSSFSGFRPMVSRSRPLRHYGDMKRIARQEFYIFARLLATQIAQYGLEDYTTNHMRVLTALTAMQSPPGTLEQRTGRTGDLVAAALGETDTDEAVEKRLEEGIYRLQHGFEINYFQLPMEIVGQYMSELIRRSDLDDEFWSNFNDVLVYDLEDLLRAQVGPLNSLDEPTIQTWVKANARPGTSEEMVSDHVKRAALNLLVEGLEKEERDELQTRLLLDHVNLEVTSIFDSERGVLVTPGDLVAATSGKWEAVLSKHGYRTAHFSQGLGAVDPTSICTTLDGAAALTEPAFGGVHLDLLFASEEGAEESEEILWNARNQLPFIMVDGPAVTTPKVERLVGLPDGRAVYRARWEIWAGWHLFWTSETIDAGEGNFSRELLVRTGAVCEDTVMAPPELVPTLVRASLLDGNFRPSTPVLGAKKKLDTSKIDSMSDEELIEAGLVQVQEGEDAKEQVEAAKEAGDEVPESIPDSVDLSVPVVGAFFNQQGAGTREDLNEVTSYFRDVIRAPLFDLAGDRSFVLTVFDTTSSEKRYTLRDRRPRTPYARRQLRVRKASEDEDRFLRSAAWGHYVAVSPESTFELVSPAYRTTESVATRTLMPRWGRNRSLEFTLHWAFGLYPIRYAKATCNDSFADADPSSVSCTDSERYNEGFSLDVGALATWWIVDDYRMALEMGPHVQLDVGPGGSSALWDEQDDRINAWTLRPQFGLQLGVRGAPDPAPLVRRAKAGLPWGAENADGVSKQHRLQLGFRTGFLLGPGYNGLEGTVPLELWFGGSLRRKRSPHASFTPYHPSTLIGPYIRCQFEFVLASETSRFKNLDYGITAIIGVRMQIRLKEKNESLPGGS